MSWTLDSGSHERPELGVCLMEAVAWVAGEPHSDAPECACPVLSAYGRVLNDAMPHDQRQRLAVFVPRLVGSKSTPDVQLLRAYRVADAAIRVFAASAFRAAGLDDSWAMGLAPITDQPSVAAAVNAANDAYLAIKAANDAHPANAPEAAADAAHAGSLALLALAVYHPNAALQAADAAEAAADAAYAAAYAEQYGVAADAADAAHATARAAKAAGVWDKAIELFDQLLPAAVGQYQRDEASYQALLEL
jgi:hypothetical protein